MVPMDRNNKGNQSQPQQQQHASINRRMFRGVKKKKCSYYPQSSMTLKDGITPKKKKYIPTTIVNVNVDNNDERDHDSILMINSSDKLYPMTTTDTNVAIDIDNKNESCSSEIQNSSSNNDNNEISLINDQHTDNDDDIMIITMNQIIHNPKLIIDIDHIQYRLNNIKRSIRNSSNGSLCQYNVYQTNVIYAIQNCIKVWSSIIQYHQLSLLVSLSLSMKESNQNDSSNNLLLQLNIITKRIKLIALQLFELIQLSLQCGPLHGAKPGYFKRCGSSFAIMIYEYLNYIQSYYYCSVLDDDCVNRKGTSSNQQLIIDNDEIHHEMNINQTDYLNNYDNDEENDSVDDNVDDGISSTDENSHDDVDFEVRSAKDLDNVDNINANYLNDIDDPNNQQTNNDTDNDSVDSMSSTDENDHDDDVHCEIQNAKDFDSNSNVINDVNCSSKMNIASELTTNRLFFTIKQVKAIELWMTRCKKIALIPNENNNTNNNIINGGDNVQSMDNYNDDNIIINVEDVDRSHERLPSKHIQKQIYDGMKNHQKKKSLRQKKKEIRLLNEKKKKS